MHTPMAQQHTLKKLKSYFILFKTADSLMQGTYIILFTMLEVGTCRELGTKVFLFLFVMFFSQNELPDNLTEKSCVAQKLVEYMRFMYVLLSLLAI